MDYGHPKTITLTASAGAAGGLAAGLKVAAAITAFVLIIALTTKLLWRRHKKLSD